MASLGKPGWSRPRRVPGLARRSPGSAIDARAKVDGPLAMVARASGTPMSTGAPMGSRPSGLYFTWTPEAAALPVNPPSGAAGVDGAGVSVGASASGADWALAAIPGSTNDDATTKP